MNKTFKFILSGLIAVLLSYFTYFLFGIVRYSHSSDFHTYKQYMWLFKDSVKKDLDTNFSYSYVKKRDIYNNLHYKSKYNIIIWEFKDLSLADLDKISINKNMNLDNIEFKSGEILNKNTDLEITINYGFIFNNIMNINIDRHSKIERYFKGPDYQGFCGSINKMSISDQKKEHQIIFNYTNGQTPIVLVTYKNHQSFFLIIINSEKKLDQNIIDILNLE